MIDSLTTVKKVNKTDAATLLNNFKVSTAFMAHPSCLHINLPDNGETSPSLQGRVDNVSRTGATKGDSSSNTRWVFPLIRPDQLFHGFLVKQNFGPGRQVK